MNRRYADLRVDSPLNAPRERRMRDVVDLLWRSLHTTGVSWAGFYVLDADNPDQLLLSCCRDKPACSPIGLHGACGTAFKSGRPLIVRDVKELGANYIACDPRDRSEVVIPCFEGGAVWGVLDLDSHDVAAFDENDVAGLTALLIRAGLTA